LDDEGLAREMARGNRCYLADTLKSQGTVCRSTPEPSGRSQICLVDSLPTDNAQTLRQGTTGSPSPENSPPMDWC
jgi:hypothetical protein